MKKYWNWLVDFLLDKTYFMFYLPNFVVALIIGFLGWVFVKAFW